MNSPVPKRWKVGFVFLALCTLVANMLLLSETRWLAKSYSDQQNQATWFLFHLSKELAELVAESRHLSNDPENLAMVELKYELTWSRFDVLLNSHQSDSFMRREHVRQQFSELFERFQLLEEPLLSLHHGTSREYEAFYQQTNQLYVEMIRYVSTNFRVASPLYQQQQAQAQTLLKAQYVLMGLFVLCVSLLIYFFYTESKHHQALALSDPLTQLPNRMSLLIRLQEHQQQHTRAQLYLLDLNGFKAINDQLGHIAGDQALIEVANRLKTLASDDIQAYRVGGDEFAILQSRHQQNSLDNITERVHRLFEPVLHLAEGKAQLSTSIGRAVYPDDANDSNSLIKCADKRMYKMKFQQREAS